MLLPTLLLILLLVLMYHYLCHFRCLQEQEVQVCVLPVAWLAAEVASSYQLQRHLPWVVPEALRAPALAVEAEGLVWPQPLPDMPTVPILMLSRPIVSRATNLKSISNFPLVSRSCRTYHCFPFESLE